MVLLPDRGGQAVRHPVPGARPTGRDAPRAEGRRGAPRRGGPARRQRARRRQRLLLPRHVRRQPRRHPAGLLHRLRPATSASPCRCKDLATGEALADEIPGIFYGGAWSADGTTFFYTTVDDAWRPNQVWRHAIGTPAEDDVLVHEETDERFWVGIGLTRSERYLVLDAGQQDHQRDPHPCGRRPGRRVPRRRPAAAGVEYARRPPRATASWSCTTTAPRTSSWPPSPLDDPGSWTPLIEHRADTRLLEQSTPSRTTPWCTSAATGSPASASCPRRRRARRDPLPRADLRRRAVGQPGVRHRAAPAAATPRWSPRTRSTTTTSTRASCSCASRRPCSAATTRPTTSSPASGRPPRTAPGSRSRSWPAKGTRTGPRPPCCTATAATSSRSTRRSPSRGCRCSTGASSSPSRTSAAAARWAATGTRTASC